MAVLGIASIVDGVEDALDCVRFQRDFDPLPVAGRHDRASIPVAVQTEQLKRDTVAGMLRASIRLINRDLPQSHNFVIHSRCHNMMEET